MTSPVAIPTRTWRRSPSARSWLTACNKRQTRAHRLLGGVLLGLRVTEIGQHPVTHVLGHEAP